MKTLLKWYLASWVLLLTHTIAVLIGAAWMGLSVAAYFGLL